MVDIPLAPGAPAILGAVSDALTAFLGGASATGATVEQWGLFDQDGNLLLDADSVVGVDYSKDYRVSDYPQEQGAFQSYNRVEQPGEPRLILTVGGSELRRTEFLAMVKTLQDSDDIYSVFTPDVIYPSVSITHYDYTRRADRGAKLLTVELHLLEIRVSAIAAFSLTVVQNPASAAPTSNGTVQPGPPVPAPAPVS